MPEHIPAHLDAVGPGWHPLLLRLHEQLLAVNPDYRVQQVKEKYGTLRIYLLTGLMRYPGWETGNLPEPHDEERYKREDEAARRLVHAAEEESARICESCGNPGETRGNSWLKTLCDDCATPR
ncbi:hypothetical protein [Spirillospora sp. CA-128828]|uniref:hypothetical protein n=1 Tax=Spirillospora sp. CA-128828 TaxID=3240033 RepID=UPI003D9233F1